MLPDERERRAKSLLDDPLFNEAFGAIKEDLSSEYQKLIRLYFLELQKDALNDK